MPNLFYGVAVFSFSNSQIRHWKLITAVSLFLTLVANKAFFKHVMEVYTLTWDNAAFIISLAALLVSVSMILLSLFTWSRFTKPILIAILMVSSLVAYFMDTYDVVIDTHMIDNIVQTNINESVDLFSFTLILYVFFIGVIPSWIIYLIEIKNISEPLANLQIHPLI